MPIRSLPDSCPDISIGWGESRGWAGDGSERQSVNDPDSMVGMFSLDYVKSIFISITYTILFVNSDSVKYFDTGCAQRSVANSACWAALRRDAAVRRR